MRHVTLALRMLRKTPFVTTVAVLSLALGIGANAAIFSLFDQMLLRPLPVPAPQELVNLGNPGPKPGSTRAARPAPATIVFSYPMFRDLEREQQVFTGIAAHTGFGANLSVRNEPIAGEGMLVSGSYFPVLQLQPALGRLLRPGRRPGIGANFVTVLSHNFWMERYGGDPGVIGEYDHRQRQAVHDHRRGAQGVRGHHARRAPEVYRALSMRGEVEHVLHALRRPPRLLGLPVRPPQARRVAGAGRRRR